MSYQTRNIFSALLLTVLPMLLVSPAAFAQSASSQLPPGHPEISQGTTPPGHPEVPQNGAMPPGHPPVPQQASNQPPVSVAFPDHDVKRGNVLVMARLPDGTPVDKDAVSITRWQQGSTDPVKKERKGASLVNGSVVFQHLRTDNDSLYHVIVRHDGVDYPSPMFRLAGPVGVRVQQFVFPATDDMDEALVGVQAFLMIEPLEHSLHVQQLFRFANLSEKTWRCKSIPVRLPPGFYGVSKTDPLSPLRTKTVAGAGILLEGFVPPGPTELALSYEVPYPSSNQGRWTFALPARVAQARVIVVAAKGMSATIPGLGNVIQQRDEEGRRLLIASKSQRPGDDQIERLEVRLDGLPVPGKGRWIALGIALLVLAAGFAEAVRKRRRNAEADEQLERDLVLGSIKRLAESWDEQRKPRETLRSYLEVLSAIQKTTRKT